MAAGEVVTVSYTPFDTRKLIEIAIRSPILDTNNSKVNYMENLFLCHFLFI